MPVYDRLSATDKDVVNAHNNTLRSWAGDLAKLMQRGLVLEDNWDAQVSAIIASLDAASTVPDSGGLSGAADITKEEFQSIMSSLSAILASYNTAGARELYVKLAGPANVV